MTKLQALTGASLAASTTRTGAAARGGNWKLEWRTPGMKTPLALSAEAQMAYGGILIPQQEYQALRALYQSTNGASWTNNTGWRDWNFNSATPPDASIVNGWHGVTVTNNRVTMLNLDSNQLTGSIPTELGNLSNLEFLWLNINQLTGSIPTELGNLSNLESLWLYSNQLTGSIPTELGNLSNLVSLRLDSNRLTGSIPTELGNLFNLRSIWLYSNQLTGSIPTELGNLSNLISLRLDSNRLTGSIPQEVLDLRASKRLENPPYVKTEITDVEFLLGNNLNIDISANFGDINNNINNYTATGLPGGVTINSRRVISGTPTTADTFTVTVTATDRAGGRGEDEFNITVSIPPLNASDYAALQALYNSTSGDNWTNTTGWDVSSPTPPSASVVNSWHGVTVVGNRVTELNLYNNSLSGTLPSELGSLSNLQRLILESNSLSGTLPSELGSLSNLQRLNLYNNSLSGTLPSELGSLSNLQYLWLYSNSLSGTIPDSINALSADKRLENPPYVEIQIPDVNAFSSEKFNFNVSGNFGDLNNNISSYGANGLPNGLTINSTTGVISGTPTTEGSFTVTVTATDMAGGRVEDEFNITVSIPPLNASDYAALQALYNSTSGDNWTHRRGWDVSSPTPPSASVVNSWHGVTVVGSRVTKLDLDSNSLSGTLPSELGSLSNLQELWLGANSLSGTIPSELGSLSNLQELWLGANSLSGTIPSELGSLSNLRSLGLGANSLSGTIPSELGSLSNLQVLNLLRNFLSGTIPSELGSLSNLRSLGLYFNSLSGTLPSELGSLSNLQRLNLYNNSLSGTIPNSINALSADKKLENPPYVEIQIPDVNAFSSEKFNFNVSGNFGDLNNNISSYGANGLPDGLTINSTTGVISGIPTTEGSFTVTVTATDRAGGREAGEKMNLILRYRVPLASPFLGVSPSIAAIPICTSVTLMGTIMMISSVKKRAVGPRTMP